MTDYTTILFDFGGVIAAEGFRTGLEAIGGEQGLDPAETFRLGKEIVFDGGYAVGAVDEVAYWNEFRRRTGITLPDTALRRHILDRFVPFPEMLKGLEQLRRRGYIVAMVSDQTNWLDELDQRHHFFPLFHRVFNSYHHGRSKRDLRFFTEVLEELGCRPEVAIFLDDDPGNVERARSVGITGLLVTSPRQALSDLEDILGKD
ncbi:HAD family hydrolase [Desulfurivibrio dismutans]|uniref:HAD family hydrolase n=1 Tax=Desulfurivibrio dismutans TaxID=1398908 RepID=UPI0023D9798B|nr:HAD family phosphatase [Desulfurivibrio alkaliphilus]MDF1614984.1 HAD family phosphatase [Desulfurivibrio alkaliphilus]